MTQTDSEPTLPAWRSVWKTDDPEWVADRAKQWRKVRRSPVFKHRFRKYEIDQIKTYFLTGSAHDPVPEQTEWRWLSYHPETSPLPVSCNTLLQVWLSPEGMDWEHVRENAHPSYYGDSRKHLRDMLKAAYPAKGSLFNRRDREIYQFFTPIRCRPSDYPDLPLEKFQHRALWVRLNLHPAMNLFLDHPYNAESLAPAALDEWCDSIVPAFLYYSDPEQAAECCRDVAATLSKALEVVADTDGYAEEQIAFCERMIDRFREMELAPGMEQLSKSLS